MPPDPARRRLLGLGAVATLAALLPACAREMPLRVAAHVWPGYELMFLARSLGWLDEDEVRLIETRNATESLAALARGEVDGAALTLDEMLRGRAMGIPLTAVLVFDISSGADVVMARPAVRAPRDLAGRRVGVELSGTGALLLQALLDKGGLTRADVVVVPVGEGEHVEAWEKEGLDAIVAYEPAASRLQAAGAYRLFDSRATPNAILDVLAMRTDVLARRGDAVRALVAAHFLALRHLQTNPRDASHRMAARLKLPSGEAYGAYRGLQLPSAEVNRRLLASGGEVAATAASLLAAMVHAGILERGDGLQALTSDAYLPRGES